MPALPGLLRRSHEMPLQNGNDRAPAGAKPDFELFLKLAPGRFVANYGKRRRAAAGHERGDGSVFAEEFLVNGKDGKLLQSRGFQRIVELGGGGARVALL